MNGGPTTTLAAPQAFAVSQTTPTTTYTQTAPTATYVTGSAYAGTAPVSIPPAYSQVVGTTAAYAATAPTYTQTAPTATYVTGSTYAGTAPVSIPPAYSQVVGTTAAYAATAPTYTQTMAPAVEYVTAPQAVEYVTGPQVEYMSAPQFEYVYEQPMVEYVSAPPAVEYVTAAPSVEYVSSAPMVQYMAPQEQYMMAPRVMQEAVEYISPVPRSQIATGGVMSGASRNLLAMGNLVSERVISVEELYAEGRFAEAPAERAVASAPMVQTYTQPTVEYIQPAVQYAQPGFEVIVDQYGNEYEVGYDGFAQEPQMIEYVTGAPTVGYF